jgi:sulfide:quinone oxidoreductase
MSDHSDHYQVVIVGGGTAGISVAARLLDRADPPSVAIIDPAQHHYYQPIWTLVGGGVVPREVSERSMASVIPRGATWIRERVASFAPSDNSVTTAKGTAITYDQLVVAPGIQLDWDKVDGLRDALGHDGVCSNYTYDQVPYTWELIRNFTGGNAVFTFPSGPIKCAGAPQKIMYLAEHAFRRSRVRKDTEVIFASAAAAIFGVPKYREALEKVIAEKEIDARYHHNLVAIDGKAKEATFEVDGKRRKIEYEMIHVTPPQSAPDFVKKSPLANSDGWVDVDRHTMQHNAFSNVFSLGDASSLPCSKTGAAIRKQAPILVENILAAREGRELTGSYDGYASCPVVTGYGKVLLAEFGYDGVVMESFPFDQAQPRYSMWALKLHALPALYWNGMLRGRA